MLKTERGEEEEQTRWRTERSREGEHNGRGEEEQTHESCKETQRQEGGIHLLLIRIFEGI